MNKNKHTRFPYFAVGALFLFLSLLAACGPADTPVPAGTTAPVQTAQPTAALPPFASDSGANFRVVRSENATQAEIDAAVSIVKAIASATGQMPELGTDFIKRDAEYDSSSYEILVGRTAYPESNAVLGELAMGEYTVRAVGSKIVVSAWSDLAVTLAANELTEQISRGLTTFGAENDFTDTFNAMLDALPVYEGGEMAALQSAGDRAYQLVTEKTTVDEWQAYCRVLVGAGFSLSSEREAAGNRFAVYRGDRYGVTTYYTPFNRTARTIIEPIENLGPVWDEAAEAGEKICTPKLTMIGRKFSENNTYRGAAANTGYMCYVLRLEDGRFIVVDGGVQSGGFAAAIMNTLREQAPDPNHIEIAAWVITHTHGDHTGGFALFCSTYAAQADIRFVMLNFPGDSDLDEHADSGGKSWARTVTSSYTSAYPQGQLIKVHNGYACSLGGADIEFLYSPEDYLTSARTLSDTKLWNNTSLIFRISIAGETIMFLGDSQVDSNTITSAMYGDYLKSDIVQVAHHGGEGGTAQIYTLIDPEVALFTTSDELMSVYLADSHNYHLVHNLHLVEYINAADRITVFDLPYTPGTSAILPG